MSIRNIRNTIPKGLGHTVHSHSERTLERNTTLLEVEAKLRLLRTVLKMRYFLYEGCSKLMKIIYTLYLFLENPND